MISMAAATKVSVLFTLISFSQCIFTQPCSPLHLGSLSLCGSASCHVVVVPTTLQISNMPTDSKMLATPAFRKSKPPFVRQGESDRQIGTIPRLEVGRFTDYLQSLEYLQRCMSALGWLCSLLCFWKNSMRDISWASINSWWKNRSTTLHKGCPAFWSKTHSHRAYVHDCLILTGLNKRFNKIH